MICARGRTGKSADEIQIVFSPSRRGSRRCLGAERHGRTTRSRLRPLPFAVAPSCQKSRLSGPREDLLRRLLL